MTIADELGTYATPNGPACRATALGDQDHLDLWEALDSPAKHSVVARWWNATRAERTSVELTPDWVARHRRKECVACR